MIDRVLARFVLTGIANTVLGLGVIFAARQWVNDFTANLIGYLVVVPISFLTHRHWSFRDAGGRWAAFLRYLPTVLTGYAINVLILHVGLTAGLNAYLVQAMAITAYVGWTYCMSRIFVFLEPRS